MSETDKLNMNLLRAEFIAEKERGTLDPGTEEQCEALFRAADTLKAELIGVYSKIVQLQQAAAKQ